MAVCHLARTEPPQRHFGERFAVGEVTAVGDLKEFDPPTARLSGL
tara:strand:- start:384 stop:518 length:135 start_codon:yes stop_codon:yes gene_type:complete